MHKKNLIHRDIKLDNILISKIEETDKYEVRVADFGITTFVTEGMKPKEICGSPSYIAPEMLGGKDYDYKVDVFSAGSVLFNLLTSRYLFSGSSVSEVLL
jgi:serine/threonine protein kinase